jgi:hypothetical protein
LRSQETHPVRRSAQKSAQGVICVQIVVEIVPPLGLITPGGGPV